jgi:hypothetical protein
MKTMLALTMEAKAVVDPTKINPYICQGRESEIRTQKGNSRVLTAVNTTVAQAALAGI